MTTLLAVASQGVQQGGELRDGIFRRSPFRLARGARAALLGLLGQSAVQLESHIGEICFCSLQLRSAAAQLFRRRVAALAQPFQFIGAWEDTAVFAAAAAGHGTAGVDDLAVQRHDAQPVSGGPRHPDGVAQAFRYNRSAQQIFKNTLIFFVKADKIERHTHKAGVVHRRVTHDAAPDRVDGKEGGTSGIPAL